MTAILDIYSIYKIDYFTLLTFVIKIQKIDSQKQLMTNLRSHLHLYFYFCASKFKGFYRDTVSVTLTDS